MSFHLPEQFRIRKGPFATKPGDPAGVFLVPSRPGAPPLRVIASSVEDWDHVSVSLLDRCPTWLEMCKVKDLFWDPEDCTMQLHPPASMHISNHPFCLHIFRPHNVEIPLPPSTMVGMQEWGELPGPWSKKKVAT